MDRFAAVGAEEIEKILVDKDSENTKMSTKAVVDVFRKYLQYKEKSHKFLLASPPIIFKAVLC